MKKTTASCATDMSGIGNVLDSINGASTLIRNSADNYEEKENVRETIAWTGTTRMEYAKDTTKMDANTMKQDVVFYT